MPFSQFVEPNNQAYNLGTSTVFLQSIPGAPIAANWEEPHVAAFNAKSYIAANHVDHLILTERFDIESVSEWHDTVGHLQLWRDQGRLGNEDIQTWWYWNWFEIPGWETTPDWQAWLKRVDEDTEIYTMRIKQLDAGLASGRIYAIPGGQALAALVEAIGDGGIRGLSDPADLFSDGVHLTDIGGYFVSLVHWATIHQKTPVGLPWNISKSHWSREPYQGLTAEMAADLQALAWNVVSSHPYAGIAEWR